MRNKGYLFIIALALSVALAACSSNSAEPSQGGGDVQAPAMVRLMYVNPSVGADDAVYRVELGGKTFDNDASAVLGRYGGVPGGGVGSFVSVPGGSVPLRLYRSTSRELCYDRTVVMAAGARATVAVYDLGAAPAVVPEQVELPTASEGQALLKFYNFVLNKQGEPMEGRLQLRLKASPSGEFVATGAPVAFGEATTWQAVTVTGTTARCDMDALLVDNDGNTLGSLTYTAADGTAAPFADYWPLEAGRAYAWYCCGTRTEAGSPLKVISWSLR